MKVTLPFNFGNELRKRRVAAGMTITRFCDAYGFKRTTINDLELGHYKSVELQLLRQLQQVFKDLPISNKGYGLFETEKRSFWWKVKQCFKWWKKC